MMAVKRKKKANPVGRPTKYTSKMLAKAMQYIEGGYLETRHSEVIPLVCGLAIHLNVNKTTLYEWIKDDKNPEFSNALKQLKDFQEMKLVNGGLTGEFNSQITKLILTNHDYSDREKINDDEVAPPLTINFNVKGAVKEIITTNAKS